MPFFHNLAGGLVLLLAGGCLALMLLYGVAG